MKAAGKTYEPVTYEGAGHGFMRAGEDPTNTVSGNKTAREQGFARLVKLLKEAKSASSAPSSTSSGVLAKASATQANSCHDVNKSLAAAGTR
jgi:carboxymethylenebutenolidase